MDPTTILNQAVPGLEAIVSYGNIALTVMFVVLGLSITMNYYLLSGLLKMKDVFYSLSLAISVLNERLGHHVDDNQAVVSKEVNKASVQGD